MFRSEMIYLTIDGDDIGHKITSAYLINSTTELVRINDLVQEKTRCIAEYLRKENFIIHFCAADGVAASIEYELDMRRIFSQIEKIAGGEITFSAGVGASLREAYVALLYAKNTGKKRLCDFRDIEA
ncbi:TPA: mCpol domain-containing protein [Pseudomonas aeruginosa]|uniref:mCpol domain-containing protein n=2 Tax=Pseudomonas TaxID=286 RepID=UPI0012AC1619|nr:mCpol domain-containing protein [Pseudomonas aeruginosa]EIU3494027.1 mCpol domain-containing protein [Pseudomonas aeruginosa]MBK1798680.1 mCpol domain-containing protein [Pseudomonas aeruginosa]MBX5817700.1 mCpol domain-containing protein [Pseudomonas aeruginosa]MBX5824753.1 mCpol domain-containing protein [Pseudomonas aeruginosa]MBX5830503.1 mCpol domain-containing protein [Pseudomonas aeruginosa]